MATAGFRALTFDHPAHGEAEGKRSNVVEMAHALGEVDAALFGAHAIVAHSLAALAATRAMTRTMSPRRAVFIAPPSEPLWPERFAANVWPDAELLATDGLGHHKILRSPEVGEAVLRFLQPLQPRPQSSPNA